MSTCQLDNIWRTFLIPVSVAILLIHHPHAAKAFPYGNPAASVKQGAVSFGVMATDVERKTKQTLSISTKQLGSDSLTETDNSEIKDQSVVLDFGVDEQLAIGGSVGKMKFTDEDGGELEGTRLGLALRINGVIATIYSGQLEFEEVGRFSGDFTQVDIGYGIAKPVSGTTAIYGAFIYSTLSAKFSADDKTLSQLSADLTSIYGQTVTVTSFSTEYEEDQPIILVIGAEFKPTQAISLEFELHAIAETGFGIRLLVSL